MSASSNKQKNSTQGHRIVIVYEDGTEDLFHTSFPAKTNKAIAMKGLSELIHAEFPNATLLLIHKEKY